MISLNLWSPQKSSLEIVFPNESQPADICERIREREGERECKGRRVPQMGCGEVANSGLSPHANNSICMHDKQLKEGKGRERGERCKRGS